MALHRGRTKVSIILNYATRYFSTKKINKNLFLISDGNPKINLESFKVNSNTSKALVVMPTWLMAKDRHIEKYAKFYLDYGFDVLSIKLQPWQLLWPVRGTQVVAANILKFLEVNEGYSPLVLHAFSIGGYLWGEALVQIEEDKKRYQSIINGTSAQIWDSLADITQIPIGTPKAIFPNNKFLEAALRSYLIFHMKTFDKVATTHYRRSRAAFYDTLLRTPMLIFGSKADPVATEETLRMLKDYWEKNGFKVHWKLWNDSPHVSHMFKNPKEYTDILSNYLKEVKVISSEKK